MLEEPSITKRARGALRRASKTTQRVIAGIFLLCGEMAMATHETGPSWNANGNNVQMPSPRRVSPWLRVKRTYLPLDYHNYLKIY